MEPCKWIQLQLQGIHWYQILKCLLCHNLILLQNYLIGHFIFAIFILFENSCFIKCWNVLMHIVLQLVYWVLVLDISVHIFFARICLYIYRLTKCYSICLFFGPYWSVLVGISIVRLDINLNVAIFIGQMFDLFIYFL